MARPTRRRAPILPHNSPRRNCFVACHAKTWVNTHNQHAKSRSVLMTRPTMTICILWINWYHLYYNKVINKVKANTFSFIFLFVCMQTKLHIFTDGSVLGNPWPWGRAAVFVAWKKVTHYTWGLPQTTNNVMELTAVVATLRVLLLSLIHISEPTRPY